MELAVTRIQAVMAIVDEMFSENDTLKTEIEVNTKVVEHLRGEKWHVRDWDDLIQSPFSFPGGKLSVIAAKSQHEANIYLFLTGHENVHGGKLGSAYRSTVCDIKRNMRISLFKYHNNDKATANVSVSYEYYVDKK